MLTYKITKEFITFLSSVSLEERQTILTYSQGIFAGVPGYKRQEVKKLNQDTSIYKLKKNDTDLIYVIFKENIYEKTMITGSDTIEELEKDTDVVDNYHPIIQCSIVQLVRNKNFSNESDNILAKLLPADDLRFTAWFKALFYKTTYPEEYKQILTSDSASDEETIAPKQDEPKGEAPVNITEVTEEKAVSEAVESKAESETADDKSEPVEQQEEKSEPVEQQEEKSEPEVTEEKVEPSPVRTVKEDKLIKASEKNAVSQLFKIRKKKRKIKDNRTSYAPNEVEISSTKPTELISTIQKKLKTYNFDRGGETWHLIIDRTVPTGCFRKISHNFPDKCHMIGDADIPFDLDYAFIISIKEEEIDELALLGVKRPKVKNKRSKKHKPVIVNFHGEEQDSVENDKSYENDFVPMVKGKKRHSVKKRHLQLAEDFDIVNNESDFIDEDGYLTDEDDICINDYDINDDDYDADFNNDDFVDFFDSI